ncbi:MAG: glycosyltransferase family 2 protein [Bacteroidales bacterium]
MKLSIIIVNYNVKLMLEQCLYSIERSMQPLPKESCEVIVVDNNSQDGSIEYLKPLFPRVTFIANNENLGFAKANNQALRISNAQYKLLLNPDTLLSEQTLIKVLEFMDSTPDAGAVGVKMIDTYGRFHPESKRSFPTPWNSLCKMFGISTLMPNSKIFARYHLRYLDKDQIHQVDVLSGAFMMLRDETLQKCGLLDEAFFMYGEDIDLSYRIQLSGYKNYYHPTTILHYKGESTKKNSLRYVKIFYGAMLIFFRKHYPHYNILFTLIIRMAIIFRASLSSFKRLFLNNSKQGAQENGIQNLQCYIKPSESIAMQFDKMQITPGPKYKIEITN